MTLRTKLIVALALLSAVPLAGISFYSYHSSRQALRQAVLWESAELADDMGKRMDGVRTELATRLERLGELESLGRLAAAEGGGDLERSALLAEITTRMGGAAPFVEALEFIPGGPPAPAAREAREIREAGRGASPEVAAVAPVPPAPPVPGVGPPPSAAGATPRPEAPPLAAGAGEAVIIFLSELAAELPAGEQAAEELWLDAVDWEAVGRRVAAETEVDRTVVDAALHAASIGLEELSGADGESPILTGTAHVLREVGRQLAERREAVAEREVRLERVVRARHDLAAEERAELEKSAEKTRQLLGRDLDCAVGHPGKEVGRLRAKLATKKLLKAVLDRTRREQGEVPFAVGAEGELYLARDEDAERIAEIREVLVTGDERAVPAGRLDRWVIVRSDDPETGLVFGIARPVHEGMAEIRRTAGRNFGYGLGLVAIALVGIFPLSGRMTRDLCELTEGAERLAGGDLGSRVPVRSKDELGRLAATFNRMAGEIEEHQRRRVEEERRRREQEVRQSLLEAEHARKSAELEEARQFQLSLLPSELPELPGVDLAVHMRTATEVGGDYYDFRTDEGGALTVAIGDATGHGARAGTMVTVIKSLFTHAGGEPLDGFLVRANDTIKRMDLGRMAMALGLARLDGDRLEVASAAMPPVLVHRAAGGEVEEVVTEALPLGGLADGRYRTLERRVAPGDTVLLMSDGFPELVGPDGEPLGYARARAAFAEAAEGTPEEIVGHLLATAEAWAGDATPSDDVTFVVLRRRRGSTPDAPSTR